MFSLFRGELFGVSSKKQSSEVIVVIGGFEGLFEVIEILVDEMVLFLLRFYQQPQPLMNVLS